MTQAIREGPLARLLFVSEATYPPGHGSDVEIFRSATRNNRACDITGVILRGSSWFCQALEGSGSALDETWQRIAEDTRHGKIRHWWQTDVSMRLFAHWHTEHWGISKQAEPVLIAMLHSGEIPTADKISLVRSFAMIRREQIRAR